MDGGGVHGVSLRGVGPSGIGLRGIGLRGVGEIGIGECGVGECGVARQSRAFCRSAISEVFVMSGTGTVSILGIAGSLRQGSFNRATLRAAQELAPDGMRIDSFDIAPIPLYNEDVRQQGFPSPVEDLRARIKAADGILFVTPEYNYSIPGVLKNAIDWASRPPEQPFDGKPIGIMGASGGALGTARAQYHLRQCFVFLNGLVMNRPEVMVPAAQTRFDAAGKLTDQATRDFIAAHLLAFKAWVLRMR
jgi:chromate reductase